MAQLARQEEASGVQRPLHWLRRMRAETFLTGGMCIPAFACGETLLSPVSLDCPHNPPCSQTNPAPDKPLALKSRGVVAFTAAEGWGTRNKSSSPVFR
ncbi:MAG: hypothetical protein CL911_02490 [Deltaproteobacteria bacterium]|nr:hypothetical protein [Deltaproteobacteria bacterium]